VSDARVIRVRFHEGRYHGAGGWPLAPARLFQALVAGVAIGRRIAEADHEALAWFESQGAPLILAPAATQGQGFNTYVPNNDLDAVSDIDTVAGNPAGYIRRRDGWEIAASTIRAAESVRPWLFDAAQPVAYLWPAVADEPEREGMAALAGRLYQLGRGIDPAWAEARLLDTDETEQLIAAHEGPVWHPAAPGPDGLAVPTRGSLASLEIRHAAFLGRFRQIGTGRGARTAFTNPPKPRFRQIRYEAPSQILLFDLRAPDGRLHALPAAEAAPLVRRLIERAAERLFTTLPAEAARIERVLIGRGTGPADPPRRVRVFAVPTLRRHVDRAIRRVAVEIPADCPLRAADVAWAFAGVSPLTGALDPETGAPILVRSDGRSMLARYCGTARLWRSETPLALPAAPRRRIDPEGPRQPKSGAERLREDDGAAGAVLSALRHIGLSERPLSIRVQLRRAGDTGRGVRRGYAVLEARPLACRDRLRAASPRPAGPGQRPLLRLGADAARRGFPRCIRLRAAAWSRAYRPRGARRSASPRRHGARASARRVG
jgi:CRISPR-associated protein Csb2